MKKNLCLLVSVIFSGCAHFDGPSKVVHFPYVPELLKAVQTEALNRKPATLEILLSEDKSNRRVYFTSLYHQHLVLGAHLGKSNVISSCPQFHHDKVEADSFGVPRIIPIARGQVEEDGRRFFPELAFDKKFSLEDYHLALQGELSDLCEEGVSDNFFKFDNLITYHAKKPTFHLKPTAMESVLKIPIFANFYLIKMIETKHEISYTYPEEKLFIRLSETHWFERYIAEASLQRGKFLRNKMVRR